MQLQCSFLSPCDHLPLLPTLLFLAPDGLRIRPLLPLSGASSASAVRDTPAPLGPEEQARRALETRLLQEMAAASSLQHANAVKHALLGQAALLLQRAAAGDVIPAASAASSWPGSPLVASISVPAAGSTRSTQQATATVTVMTTGTSQSGTGAASTPRIAHVDAAGRAVIRVAEPVGSDTNTNANNDVLLLPTGHAPLRYRAARGAAVLSVDNWPTDHKAQRIGVAVHTHTANSKRSGHGNATGNSKYSDHATSSSSSNGSVRVAAAVHLPTLPLASTDLTHTATAPLDYHAVLTLPGVTLAAADATLRRTPLALARLPCAHGRHRYTVTGGGPVAGGLVRLEAARDITGTVTDTDSSDKGNNSSNSSSGCLLHVQAPSRPATQALAAQLLNVFDGSTHVEGHDTTAAVKESAHALLTALGIALAEPSGSDATTLAVWSAAARHAAATATAHR